MVTSIKQRLLFTPNCSQFFLLDLKEHVLRIQSYGSYVFADRWDLDMSKRERWIFKVLEVAKGKLSPRV